jgi:hypothetical protein
MVDVVRGAVAEVEDYTRVNVLPLGSVALAGRAVGDVIHLLAELVENGLSFSPPHTTVEVRGQMVANGFAIEIEDRGLGMSEEDLAAANERIVDRSELNLANATRLGLYVVSRLTERHGVRVQLKESPYGGTTAVVLIPIGLVTEGDDPNSSGGFRTGAAVERPASPPTPGPEPTPARSVAIVAAGRRGAAGGRERRAGGRRRGAADPYPTVPKPRTGSWRPRPTSRSPDRACRPALGASRTRPH